MDDAFAAELIRSIPEPLLLVREDGVILASNAASDELFGFEPGVGSEIELASRVAETPAQIAAFLQRWARGTGEPAALTRRTRDGALEPVRCDGALVRPRDADSPAWLLLRCTRREDTPGRVVLLNEKIGELSREVAERRRAEAELYTERESYRVTLASIGDAVIATDVEGRITFMNKVAEQQTGWPLAEAAGRRIEEVFRIVDEASRAPLDSPVAAAVREGAAVGIARHSVLLARDGTERPIGDSTAPIRDEAGRILGAILVFRDVGERRRSERALAGALAREQGFRQDAETANRMKDEFLATVSHELRTPMNVILGWAQILVGDALPAQDLHHGLETIERNARMQMQLIDDLIDVSRIISGKLRLDVQPVDLAKTVDSALDVVRPSAQAKEIRLERRFDLPPPALSGDPNRLQQVFWNLLSNAIKFTPQGGRVELCVVRAGSHLEVSVSDTGIGIEPEFLPHVFERFRQADSSMTRKHGGLGLGLSIVRQLVELHGGSVSATSSGRGTGATFTVRLPLPALREVIRQGPTVPADLATREPAWPAIRLDRIRVLVVDDDADARELLRRVLGARGAQVETAASVRDALEALETFQPDVLISDIGMPGEDGYALMRQVRLLPAERGGRVPAVALTAFAGPADRLRALLAGYQIHIPKPVETTELLAVVANLGAR